MQNGIQFLREVQAALILQGKTLSGVCRELGVPQSNLRAYVFGFSSGKESKAALIKVLEATGLQSMLPEGEREGMSQ